MYITLRINALKKAILDPAIKTILFDKMSYWDKEKIEGKREGSTESDTFTFNLPDFKKADLKKLQSNLAAIPGIFPQTVQTIQKWMEALDNPANAPVTSLQNMEKVFNELYKQLPNKWLIEKSEDGTTNPVLVTDFKYRPGTRDSSAHFYISYEYGMYFPKDNDTTEQCHTVKESIVFYKSSTEDWDSEDEYEINLGSDDDDDDDDQEENSTKKTKKLKKDGLLLSEILAKKGLYLPTKEIIKTYIDEQKAFAKVASQPGAMYTNDGLSYTIFSRGYGGFYYRPVLVQEEGVHNKLVVDMTGMPDSVKRNSQAKSSNEPLPYHPYVVMYDITKHRPVLTHVTLLKEYEYNTQIMNELVLPNEQKVLLKALIEGEQNFLDEIIKGKSGGIIILGSGDAGLGKTLTAEVCSEVLKKPLYSIQSSQLGIEVKDIENNLYEILKRAQRWNAVLLIDECDTYVYKRGENILQNCIVGTFLRLLEYFSGVMFMTTNRHDIVDPAIMSRVTAHIGSRLAFVYNGRRSKRKL